MKEKVSDEASRTEKSVKIEEIKKTILNIDKSNDGCTDKISQLKKTKQEVWSLFNNQTSMEFLLWDNLINYFIIKYQFDNYFIIDNINKKEYLDSLYNAIDKISTFFGDNINFFADINFLQLSDMYNLHDLICMEIICLNVTVLANANQDNMSVEEINKHFQRLNKLVTQVEMVVKIEGNSPEMLNKALGILNQLEVARTKIDVLDSVNGTDDEKNLCSEAKKIKEELFSTIRHMTMNITIQCKKLQSTKQDNLVRRNDSFIKSDIESKVKKTQLKNQSLYDYHKDAYDDILKILNRAQSIGEESVWNGVVDSLKELCQNHYQFAIDPDDKSYIEWHGFEQMSESFAELAKAYLNSFVRKKLFDKISFDSELYASHMTNLQEAQQLVSQLGEIEKIIKPYPQQYENIFLLNIFLLKELYNEYGELIKLLGPSEIEKRDSLVSLKIAIQNTVEGCSTEIKMYCKTQSASEIGIARKASILGWITDLESEQIVLICEHQKLINLETNIILTNRKPKNNKKGNQRRKQTKNHVTRNDKKENLVEINPEQENIDEHDKDETLNALVELYKNRSALNSAPKENEFEVKKTIKTLSNAVKNNKRVTSSASSYLRTKQILNQNVRKNGSSIKVSRQIKNDTRAKPIPQDKDEQTENTFLSTIIPSGVIDIITAMVESQNGKLEKIPAPYKPFLTSTVVVSDSPFTVEESNTPTLPIESHVEENKQSELILKDVAIPPKADTSAEKMVIIKKTLSFQELLELYKIKLFNIIKIEYEAYKRWLLNNRCASQSTDMVHIVSFILSELVELIQKDVFIPCQIAELMSVLDHFTDTDKIHETFLGKQYSIPSYDENLKIENKLNVPYILYLITVDACNESQHTMSRNVITEMKLESLLYAQFCLLKTLDYFGQFPNAIEERHTKHLWKLLERTNTRMGYYYGVLEAEQLSARSGVIGPRV